jgi:transcriptional regulator with XRE-family HTH domain
MAKNFTRNMKKIMSERNISYPELEKQTGISRSSLNEYANERHKISLEYAVTIANVLGKGMDEMLV